MPHRLDHELDIGLLEVVSLEQQRLAEIAGEGVGEAVAHVQPSRAAARPPEASVGVSGDPRLLGRQRLDSQARVQQEPVQRTREDRILPPVDDDPKLDVGRRGDPRIRRVGNQSREGDALGLATEDRDDDGRVDDHLGRPASS